ncbi:MAG TPA: hypothetical protein VK400_15195 [Pyrinomonadaceae bacterium]|nr:hypothetical protein [Pyrinomonadaceae bacterium]
MKKFSERNQSPPPDEPNRIPEEKPDSWWNRVYGAVMATTVLVITALWFFSRYFS